MLRQLTAPPWEAEAATSRTRSLVATNNGGSLKIYDGDVLTPSMVVVSRDLLNNVFVNQRGGDQEQRGKPAMQSF